eukprot:m.289371 g.289371  ORF g.289371 m.289371 type:complete len:236 (+) comp12123_c0_seq1:176-883(+)
MMPVPKPRRIGTRSSPSPQSSRSQMNRNVPLVILVVFGLLAPLAAATTRAPLPAGRSVTLLFNAQYNLVIGTSDQVRVNWETAVQNALASSPVSIRQSSIERVEARAAGDGAVATDVVLLSTADANNVRSHAGARNVVVAFEGTRYVASVAGSSSDSGSDGPSPVAVAILAVIVAAALIAIIILVIATRRRRMANENLVHTIFPAPGQEPTEGQTRPDFDEGQMDMLRVKPISRA